MSYMTPGGGANRYDLPWHHGWPWGRCRAHTGYKPDEPYWGRCDLARGHPGDHALERGMEVLRWSTKWTQPTSPQPPPTPPS